jgi:hypothetical protein
VADPPPPCRRHTRLRHLPRTQARLHSSAGEQTRRRCRHHRRIVVTRRLPPPVLQRLAAGLVAPSPSPSPSPHLAVSVWDSDEPMPRGELLRQLAGDGAGTHGLICLLSDRIDAEAARPDCVAHAWISVHATRVCRHGLARNGFPTIVQVKGSASCGWAWQRWWRPPLQRSRRPWARQRQRVTRPTHQPRRPGRRQQVGTGRAAAPPRREPQRQRRPQRRLHPMPHKLRLRRRLLWRRRLRHGGRPRTPPPPALPPPPLATLAQLPPAALVPDRVASAMPLSRESQRLRCSCSAPRVLLPARRRGSHRVRDGRLLPSRHLRANRVDAAAGGRACGWGFEM